jgi:hypothetical protein
LAGDGGDDIGSCGFSEERGPARGLAHVVWIDHRGDLGKHVDRGGVAPAREDYVGMYDLTFLVGGDPPRVHGIVEELSECLVVDHSDAPGDCLEEGCRALTVPALNSLALLIPDILGQDLDALDEIRQGVLGTPLGFGELTYPLGERLQSFLGVPLRLGELLHPRSERT